MKGLTPAEVGFLAEMVVPHAPTPVSQHEFAILFDLEEQGRVRRDFEINKPRGRWVVTPSGREAFRLWLALREHFAPKAQP